MAASASHISFFVCFMLLPECSGCFAEGSSRGIKIHSAFQISLPHLSEADLYGSYIHQLILELSNGESAACFSFGNEDNIFPLNLRKGPDIPTKHSDFFFTEVSSLPSNFQNVFSFLIHTVSPLFLKFQLHRRFRILLPFSNLFCQGNHWAMYRQTAGGYWSSRWQAYPIFSLTSSISKQIC